MRMFLTCVFNPGDFRQVSSSSHSPPRANQSSCTCRKFDPLFSSLMKHHHLPHSDLLLCSSQPDRPHGSRSRSPRTLTSVTRAEVMQFQHSHAPLYAPTPAPPVHPTPFYIEDILGRSTSASGPVAPTPTLPSPNSSFTSLIPSYRTPIYEPTPIHPVLSQHALAATYASIYPFQRSVGDFTHALIRHDPLGEISILSVMFLLLESYTELTPEQFCGWQNL